MLNLLGVCLGPEEHRMKPTPDNPKGFWEHQLLTDLNDEILRRLGGSWHEPPTFPYGWETTPELADLRQRARAIIGDDFSGSELWGWKDPRTCLTLPVWRRLVSRARYVICLRNPVDVARSLERRDGFPLEKGAALWLAYVKASLELTSGEPRLFVFYEDLMERWQDQFLRLARFLDRAEIAERADIQEAVSEFVEPALQHHRTALLDVVDEARIGLPVKALYTSLRLYVSGRQESGSVGLDASLPKALDTFAVYCLEAQRQADRWRVQMTDRERALAELRGRAEGLERTVAEQDARLVAVAAEREREAEQSRDLREELAASRQELSGALEAVKRGEGESQGLRAEAAELRRELSGVLEAVRKGERENQRLRAEADHRSKEVAAVFNSWSWRLTQPLRHAWDFAGRLASQDGDALPPGFRGNLDLPLRSAYLENGLLRMSGWCFSEGSPIVALTASCNGATDPLNHGVSRKDVQAALPQVPQAEASGFEGFLPIGLRRRRRIIVAVHAELEDGRKVPLFKRRVRLSSPAVARLYGSAKFFVLLARRMAVCAWAGYWPRSREEFLSRYRMFKSEIMARERVPPTFPDAQRQYEAWLAEHRLTPERLAALREETRRLAYRPTISVVVPVYDVAEAWLRGAIESVRAQAYENWELCLVNDASPAPHVRAVLDEYAALDARVRVAHLAENAGIAGASNHGLRLATGEFVGFLDHDDVLYPDALAEVVRRLDRDPSLDVLYSDDDRIEPDGRRSSPFFKPDWSPDLLLACNYICHFSTYRRSLLEEMGGFRAGFDGSQDYDLVLRATERTRRIAHIPKILYGWRKVPASAAATVAAKPYAYRAGQAAIAEALARRGVDAKVEMFIPIPGYYHVRYALCGNPKVSIIIPMRDRADLTRQCVASIESKSTYRNIELLVIDNGSVEEASRRLLDELALRHRVVRYDRPFNYSAINNFGAAHATGDYLLFLNNDTEVETPNWLEAMLEHAQRGEVAAVGAKLLYPNRRIQHAGVFLMATELAVAGHVFKHLPEDTPTWYALARVARNVSAVTGACMLVRRQIFEELGGFDERIRVAFNDVDLCLRMRQAGYLVVYTPLATLIHHESATRKALHPPEDEQLVREKWQELLAAGDPYYNPNLSRTREDVALDIVDELPHRREHAQALQALVDGQPPWCVDSVRLAGNSLELVGWAIAPRGDCSSVSFTVNDRKIEMIQYPLPSDDVYGVFWHLPYSRRSRFTCRAELTPEEAGHPLALKFVHNTTLKPLNEEHNYYYVDARRDPIPFPDAIRRLRVHGSMSEDTFRLQGYSAYVKLRRALEKVFSKDYAAFGRILDWGCGCGRVTRYFNDVPASITGVDIDEDNAMWCRAHLTFGRFLHIPLHPPTGLDAASADLIIGISVFTHLREKDQYEWLAELSKIAAQGAVLLMSVHGDTAMLRANLPHDMLRAWRERGFLDVGSNPGLDAVVHDKHYYRNVFHTREYIREKWSQYFDILEIIPGYIGNHQDLVIMRKA